MAGTERFQAEPWIKSEALCPKALGEDCLDLVACWALFLEVLGNYFAYF